MGLISHDCLPINVYCHLATYHQGEIQALGSYLGVDLRVVVGLDNLRIIVICNLTI